MRLPADVDLGLRCGEERVRAGWGLWKRILGFGSIPGIRVQTQPGPARHRSRRIGSQVVEAAADDGALLKA